MNVTLLRHAPVEKKFLNSFNGWIDIDIQIDKNSKKIIKLKETLLKSNFDQVYSSDLKRCVNTLKILGFFNFTKLFEFREIAFRDFAEGRSFEEIEKINPLPLEAFENIEKWINFIAKESLNEFLDRVKRGIKKLRGENILICTHKGVIEAFLKIYKDIEFFSEKISYLEVIQINNLLIRD